MKLDEKPAQARPGFRLLAAIISVGTLTLALPMSVLVAVRSDSSMWLVAFPSLVVGIEFGTVAVTGHSFCFRKAYHETRS